MRRTKNAVKFTHEWLDGLGVPAERMEWVDSGCDCLSLRLGKSGVKIFYFLGRINGPVRRMKIGEYPHMSLVLARKEVARMLGEAAIGKDPMPRSMAARKERTFGQLIDWYMKTHSKPHKKSTDRDKDLFDNRFKKWRKRPLSWVTKERVKEYFTKIGEEYPSAANRMLAIVGSMWRLGQDELGFTTPDPTKKIKRFASTKRKRFVTQEEIELFFQAVQALRYQVSRDYILLCLFTGARRSNVCAMRWDQLSLAQGFWDVPSTESKNKEDLRIALPRPALLILQRRKAESNSGWVFPGRGSKGHYNEPKGAMESIRDYMGVEDLRLHDLRRTLGSWQAEDGVSMQTIQKTLGHESIKSTEIYARLTMKPVKTSVEKVTSKMIKIGKPQSLEVQATAKHNPKKQAKKAVAKR